MQRLDPPGTFTRQVSPTASRRLGLTQIDVASGGGSGLKAHNKYFLLCAAAVEAAYILFVLPRIESFGTSVAKADTPQDGVARHSDVSSAYIMVLSIAYLVLSLVGMQFMKKHQSPARAVFECVAVHNFAQCLFNVYCTWALISWRWGNLTDDIDSLRRLIWLQYHCRQLQLLDTAVMVLRKKSQSVFFLHLYLRVLQLWGWFIACRFVSCTDAFTPALICSVCQGLVYGLYVCSSIQRLGEQDWLARGTLVSAVNIAQYIACALHSIIAATFGDFPRGLAVLHLFAIANGLVLYTDFHSERPRLDTDTSNAGSPDDDHDAATAKKRVTFSFDSCGWLMVYHFGVGYWLFEHLRLGERKARKDVAFSGSSGGALIACVLAAGNDPREVFEYILEQLPLCRRNPREMFPAVERALRKYAYEGAPEQLRRRLRVLLTRVAMRPPFVMGEIVEEFSDNEFAVNVLCASCHVPVFAGLLPRKIGDRWYYDGLAWPSALFVPWRGARGDHVVRVSACGSPLADFWLSGVPKWWGILPPKPETLRGIFWCGYRDAARWFKSEPRPAMGCCAQRGSAEARDNTQSPSHGTEAARWRAARGLLRTQPAADGDGLPDEDENACVNGRPVNVHNLISRTEAKSGRESNVFSGLLAAAAVAVAAAAAARIWQTM